MEYLFSCRPWGTPLWEATAVVRGDLGNLMAVTAGEEAAMDIQAFTTLPSDHKVALEA